MFFCNTEFTPQAGHGSLLFPLLLFAQSGQVVMEEKKSRANDLLLLPTCWVVAQPKLLQTPVRAFTKRELQGLVLKYHLI